MAYQFLNFSDGTASGEGRWAQGPSIDGRGEFTYVEDPPALGEAPALGPVDPRVHGAAKSPLPAAA